MTARNHVLGGGEATFAIARVTFKRTLRGKSLWIVLGLCLLPELFAMAAIRDQQLAAWPEILGMCSLMIALLPPILLANTIGEEIEERTMAYLWSRPLPRWSILTGKMLALVPLLGLMLCASMALPYFTALGSQGQDHMDAFGYSMLAVFAGTVASSAATAGLATLAPRFGTVLGIGYLLLVDGTLAALETSISNLSITYNTLQLSGARELAHGNPAAPAWESIGWLAGISAVWMVVAVLRIRRIE